MSTYQTTVNPGGVIGAIGDHAHGVVNAAGPTAEPERHGPTIGIVAALQEEHIPVQRLMDGVRRVDVSGDRAHYRLGTMPSRNPARPHRMVLTLSGDTGNTSAADACTNLIRSFPTTAYVLMVGIAAGIPGAGVRPGDILVSTGGIVDYDHVVQYGDRVELRRPFPRPSPFLVPAVRELAMEAAVGSSPWARFLSVGDQLPGYARPDGDRNAVPQVHQGRIGSADRSLSNAVVRDQLAARHQLIGIEMEGAGIGNSSFLNGLEYLVIRGASDLAQAGRDDTWRRYAALSAAAYTRGLLEACAPVAARGGLTEGVPG